VLLPKGVLLGNDCANIDRTCYPVRDAQEAVIRNQSNKGQEDSMKQSLAKTRGNICARAAEAGSEKCGAEPGRA
jgi:hypothetical protein